MSIAHGSLPRYNSYPYVAKRMTVEIAGNWVLNGINYTLTSADVKAYPGEILPF